MTLLGVIILLVVVGIVLWLINSYVPMDPKIKTILNVVVVLFVIIILLRAFGFIGYLNQPVGVK